MYYTNYIPLNDVGRFLHLRPTEGADLVGMKSKRPYTKHNVRVRTFHIFFLLLNQVCNRD